MNGWQRIGLAAFVVWALAGFGLFWTMAHRDANSHYTLCSVTYASRATTGNPDPKWHNICLERG